VLALVEIYSHGAYSIEFNILVSYDTRVEPLLYLVRLALFTKHDDSKVGRRAL
jgi:hypothetical protein